LNIENKRKSDMFANGLSLETPAGVFDTWDLAMTHFRCCCKMCKNEAIKHKKRRTTLNTHLMVVEIVLAPKVFCALNSVPRARASS